ncbi:MAG: lipopolysaccharide biosynthesis protein, partial [Pseudomonadota bacterium]
YNVEGSPDRANMTADDVVTDLRRRISIVTASTAGRRSGDTDIVNVSFAAPNAKLSADVTNELVTMILDANVTTRTSTTRQTLEFFKDDVARLDRELAERRAAILAFQERNLDSLPDSLEFRRGQQSAAQERVQQLSREETALRDRRNRLEALYESTGNVPIEVDARRTPAEAALADLEQQMAEMTSRLSPQHPSVRILSERIDAARERVAIERNAQPADATTGTVSTVPSAFQLQIADIDSQLEFIAEEKEQLREQMEALSVTIAATPGNAITLETMERDYEVIRTQYDEAVNDLAQAQTGDTIEVLAKGQRIEVIEPAIPPASPESPNRKLIAAGGVVMGGMLGLSLVVLLELLNSSVRRPADLRRGLGIEPFGTLPLIQTPGQIRLRRAKIMLAFLAVAVVVPAGLWWVHTEVTPLDRLIDRALDEIGVTEVRGTVPT